MLRTKQALPSFAAKLLYQVGASVAATLVASAIITSLPRSGDQTAAPTVELTSGGKFAARILDAGNAGLQAVVATAQLPVMTMMPNLPDALDALAEGKPAEVAGAADVVAKALDPAKIARSKAHVAPRLERPHVAEASPSAPAPHPSVVALADTPHEAEGMLPKITSSARSVWSMTTSAGGSLLSHILP